MKCDKCNTIEDQGANQVFQCDSCREMFVAVEQDHFIQQVLEAAFEWRKDFIEGEYGLLKAVKAHPDFKGKK